MEHTESSITKLFIQCTLWLMLAIAIAVTAAIVPIFPSEETQASWFQRSGALVVLLAVWVEFKLFPLNTYFDKSAYSVPIVLPNSHHLAYKYITTVTIFLAITGTFIWGYGDLFLYNT